MNKQKMFSLTLISVLLLSSIILFTFPNANATPNVLALNGYPTTNGAAYMNILHPYAGSTAGYQSAVSYSFLAVNTGYVTALTLKATKSNEPVMSIKAAIYASDGDYQSTPQGSVLSTSTNTINAADVVTGQEIIFTFDGQTQLTSGQYYTFIVYASSVTTASDLAYLAVQTYNGEVYGGYRYVYKSNSWTSEEASKDVYFILSGDTTPTQTPTASPAPSTYQYWNGSTWINYTPATPEPNIFDNGVAAPYIQLMVPIILLAVGCLLGYKFAGPWGFFAGLNVAAILTYMVLGASVFPLWGIIVLLVVDGLLLFGKIGLRS